MSDKFCMGCGVRLQDENMSQEGYVSNIENDLCSRCFRMKNYGEYQMITKSNEEYVNILKEVDKTKDLVLYIVDVLNLGNEMTSIKKYLSNDMILVINKRDVLPKSVKDDKIINYIKKMDLDVKDMIVISCEKNYHLDELLAMIKKYKNSNDVYVVGNTNVGKSSLINKMIKHYSDCDAELTISPLPSTTLNKIVIKIDKNLNIIDTPGLVNHGNITNYVDDSHIKKINPKKEIKPRTYQIKPGQTIVIGDLIRLDYIDGEKNSFTLFLSNDIKVKRYNAKRCELLRDLSKQSRVIDYDNDLVIDGLGFIKIVLKAKVDVYADININIFERESLI